MSLSIEQKAKYSGPGHWKWSVWIDGASEELKSVAQVRYLLHPTFNPPSVVVATRRTKFRLDSSGWGEFTIRADVSFVDGSKTLRLEHDLKLEYPKAVERGGVPKSVPTRYASRHAPRKDAATGRTLEQAISPANAPTDANNVLDSTVPARVHVLLIHGMPNTPDAGSLLQSWLDALAEGDGIDLRQPDIAVTMVYWADVLYAEPPLVFESPRDADGPATGLSDWEFDLPPQEQFFVESLRSSFRTASRKGASALASQEAGDRVLERIPLPSEIGQPSLESVLRDVHHYLFNAEFAPLPGRSLRVQDEIRRRVLAALNRVSAPRLIVISHGTGTVIAYDCLKRVAECPPIDMLMTIGSPLGLDEIQDLLRPEWTRNDGFPAQHVGHWTNVFDRLDPVCGFDPAISNDFKRKSQQVIEDIHEPNGGWWRHDVRKYLHGPLLRGALQRKLQEPLITESACETESSYAVKSRAAAIDIGVPCGQPEDFASTSPGTTALESLPPGEMSLQPSPNAKSPGRADVSIVVFLGELRGALESFDNERVASLCDAFVARLRAERSPPSSRESASLLLQLRRKRAFRQMRQVADALIEAGQTAPVVRRQYAQAMIDVGAIAAGLALALDLVRDLEQEPRDDRDVEKELAEAKGLIGRCYKQWYILSGNPQFLQHAIEAYDSVYRESPSAARLWHGINVVALLARAQSSPVSTTAPQSYQEIARNVLSVVESMSREGTAQYWERAIGMEACVALRRYDQAILWARDYVHSEGVDAFELASSLRQLKEVWRLDAASESGRMLLPLLEAELLKRQGGQVTVGSATVVAQDVPESVANGHWEKVFGRDSYKTYQWFELGRERCRGVARIETRTGQGVGTGFLVRGSDLKADWGDEYLLVTNNHVLSEQSTGNSLTGEQAFARFCAIEPNAQRPHRIAAILASSGQNDLDFTIARLDPPPSLPAPWPLSAAMPNPQTRQRLYAIGHPLGGDLSLSLQDNLLVDFLEPRVHYRTPTDPGSSGSPIFDDEWNLVALHHAGSRQIPRLHGAGTYEANEGIWIGSIRRHLSSSVRSAEPAPAQVGFDSAALQNVPTDRTSSIPRRPQPVSLAARTDMPVQDSAAPGGSSSVSIDFELGGLRVSVPVQVSVTFDAPVERPAGYAASVPELLEAKQPVVFPRLDRRHGYDPDFLKLDGDIVPLPELTDEGKRIAARLDDGSAELRYHRFSIVMHKLRRMALFTASNVDYRDKVRKINGKKPTRKELDGFASSTSELWLTDDRIPENQQLPDKFYTKDGGAFDKGHIVRRDDVCWGTTFQDMQMGNGDTFHTTNCSPQISGFNQSSAGDDNWGDLESMIQQQTRTEQVAVFAGPVLDDEGDQRFEGVDKRGDVLIQIPSRFWKIIVARGDNGPEAYGFVLEQDLSRVPLEFAVPAGWRRYMERISEIENMLFGKVSLEWLKKFDQFERLRGGLPQ